MKISQAKEIQGLGDAGSICVLDPMHHSENNGSSCTIRNVQNGWVLIRTCDVDMNVRASQIKTLQQARAAGWR